MYGPGEAWAGFPSIGLDPQFVTFVWEMNITDQATEVQPLILADWSDQYGLADETASLRHKVEIDTSLVSRPTQSGVYVLDDVFVTGFPDDHGSFEGAAGFVADTDTMDQKLFWFPDSAPVDESVTEATLIAETTIPAQNGLHAYVGGTDFKIPTGPDGECQPGTVVFVTSFVGDDRVAPFTTSVTDATEQFNVVCTPEEQPRVTPATPQVRTTATVNGDADTDTAVPGDMVCEVAAGSGFPANTEVTVNADLYRDASSSLTRQPTVPDDATLLQQGTTKVTTDANGEFVTEPFNCFQITDLEAGHALTYVESTPAGTSPEGVDYPETQADYGHPDETVSVNSPAAPVEAAAAGTMVFTGGQATNTNGMSPWVLAGGGSLLVAASVIAFLVWRRRHLSEVVNN
jgi:hypothetical protein